MNRIVFPTLFLCFMCLSLISCEPEEEDHITSSPSTNTSQITMPVASIESRKANANYDGWWVIAKVTTGGDDPSNVNCYLEWSAFSSKQSGTINFTHKDRMIPQASSSQRVLFKKEHAGIARGTYIYYRVVGSNSKYSHTSQTDYMVATN